MKNTPDHEYLARKTAEEMLNSSSPHQKALLRILALSREHGVSPVEPVTALGYELGQNRRFEMFDFAGLLETKNYLESINESEKIVSPHSMLALNLAEQNGGQFELFEALLDPTLGRDPIVDSGYYSKFFWLTMKVFFISSVVGFIAVKVVPEFKDMLEEFGVENPPAFEAFAGVVDWVPLAVFVYMVVLLFIALYSGSPIRKYFRRWSPTRWRQPVVSKKINRLSGLAIIAQPPNEMSDSFRVIRKHEILSDQFKEFLRLEYAEDPWKELERIDRIKPVTSRALIEAESDEARAWLLRWVAQARTDENESGARVWSRGVFAIVNFCLAMVVALAAFAVFSVLLQIIQKF